MSKKIISAGVLVLVIAGVWIGFNPAEEKVGSTANDEVRLNELIVNSQITETEAVVFKARLEQSGYIVLREVVEGRLGQILEVTEYLPSGTYGAVKILLPEAPDDSVDVIAVLYKDDGDKGFNSVLDTPVTYLGVPIASSFATGQSVPAEVFVSKSGLLSTPEEDVTYVTYTDMGYSPKMVDIKLGDTVVFTNESSKDMWVASDPHPTHTDLSTFDEFGFASSGEQYEYTFDRVGEWKYHDHINAASVGIIIVTK